MEQAFQPVQHRKETARGAGFPACSAPQGNGSWNRLSSLFGAARKQLEEEARKPVQWGRHVPRSRESTPHPEFYRRSLPHWQPACALIFLTWRLHGSLPQGALRRLEDERRLLEAQPVRPDETPRERRVRHGKGLFHLADELLGSNAQGPRWLQDERIAVLVVDALFYHDKGLYDLFAFVVMHNHVHVLLRPLAWPLQAGVGRQRDKGSSEQPVPLRRITQSLKGYTAREANRLLKRTGQPFWQGESYDHWLRSEAELSRVVEYIEGDPVRAGVVNSAQDWRWSSAWERAWGRLKDRSWRVE